MNSSPSLPPSSFFFAYPDTAKFGRIVSKGRIYTHARASAKLQNLFVEQVERIVWKYKLAPETINLESTRAVPEIQIFEVALRMENYDEAILRAMDKAIPFPLIFELRYGDSRQAVAAYKRPAENAANKWVVSEYFASPWEAGDNLRSPLPAALTLGGLYDKLLGALIPPCAGRKGPLAQRVARMESIRAKQREIERIRARLAREKQFNRRTEINASLRKAMAELEQLEQKD